MDVHRNTYLVTQSREVPLYILAFLPLLSLSSLSRVVPDCGYHIYRLIKGLSELDTRLRLRARVIPRVAVEADYSPGPCPDVRNIRLSHSDSDRGPETRRRE